MNRNDIHTIHKKRVIQDYDKYKKLIRFFVRKGQLEKALQTVYFACGFMYTMNQLFFDDELERIVLSISKKIIEEPQLQEVIPKRIVFYDGFGNLRRGLSRIYLDALKELGYIVKYVTFNTFNEKQTEFFEVVGQENVYFVKGETYIEQIKSLYLIVNECKADKVFICMNPDDVVAVGVFSLLAGKLRRYILNITDHAFWLGINACDKIINFREFGEKVCVDCRKISIENVAYIPYYPHLDTVEKAERTEELPSRKYIFSGGSIYKTESRDKKYYILVKHILDSFDVDFVYMGNGVNRYFRKLQRQYPNRVLVTKESNDFLEVLKKSICYLSTYPYNGGLMTQYSLAARRVPVTLCCPGIDKELTIEQERTFWNYKTVDECVCEVGKLIHDNVYKKRSEERLSDFLISSEQFKFELDYFLNHEESIRKVTEWKYECEGFRKIPLESQVGLRYARLFFRKRGLYLFVTFPIKCIAGAVYLIWEKIYKIR